MAGATLFYTEGQARSGVYKPIFLSYSEAARVKLVVASFMQPIDLNCDWLIRLQRLNRAPDLR